MVSGEVKREGVHMHPHLPCIQAVMMMVCNHWVTGKLLNTEVLAACERGRGLSLSNILSAPLM